MEIFRLPKEETIREKWISIIRQCVGENWEPTEGTYLCSHHFADSNFIQPQDELVKVDTKPTILVINFHLIDILVLYLEFFLE